ncbi:MAG: hypothetical protein ACPGJV_08050 [Bacteriovoracaceae bacterium]
MISKIFKFTSILSLLLFVACDEVSSPEAALRKFIKVRFDPGSDKKDFLDITVGDLRKEIESMSKEEFKMFRSSMNGVKKHKVDVVHSTCQSKTCHFTYVISLNFLKYAKDSGVQKRDFRMDVKKVAILEKVSDKLWQVSDVVSESKTFVKGFDPITPDEFEKKFGVSLDKIKADHTGRPLRDESGDIKQK